jgi:transcriptional regulator with XRE-family HTH domain
LRDVREQARRSQAQVAAAAGLSRPFSIGIEAGQRNVGLDNVFAIADALRVDIVD